MSTAHTNTAVQCLPVDGSHAAGVSGVQGAAFDIAIHVLRAGESLEAPANSAGEEVGAILDGSFSIEAADEKYQLSRGEGIIIPTGAARKWVCNSDSGRLYRVVNRLSLAAGGAGEQHGQ